MNQEAKKAKYHHYCRWLKGSRRYDCWQTTARLKKSLCTPCLLAMVIGGLYSVTKPSHRPQPRNTKN